MYIPVTAHLFSDMWPLTSLDKCWLGYTGLARRPPYTSFDQYKLYISKPV